MNNAELLNSIKNDSNSCFDINYIFEFDNALYEMCDFDHHKYRVIFSTDDYDYVEDEELIHKLNIAYLVQV